MGSEPNFDIDKWLNRVPAPGETCVFSNPSQWKRDALLFDRVYAPVTRNMGEPPAIPLELSFGVTKLDEDVNQYVGGLMTALGAAYPSAPKEHQEEYELGLRKFIDQSEVKYEREQSRCYWQAGIMASWSFGERGLYLRRFTDGECIAYQGALQNLPIVLNDAVSREQIWDFRNDQDAVRKYRDLRVWLRDGVKASTTEQAADIIAQKIENYRWAIQKHGLKTTIGALTHLFQWKEGSVAVAAGAGVGAIGGPGLGALAAGVVALAKLGIYIAEQLIDEKEVRRGTDRDVAILYEVQKQFGGADTAKS